VLAVRFRQQLFAGELVYTTPGDGTYRVYLSLQNGNADNPATATATMPPRPISKIRS
jgi:hypothetical protein